MFLFHFGCNIDDSQVAVLEAQVHKLRSCRDRGDAILNGDTPTVLKDKVSRDAQFGSFDVHLRQWRDFHGIGVRF